MEVHISRYVVVLALFFHHLSRHLRASQLLALRQSLLLGTQLALVKLSEEILVHSCSIVAGLYLHGINLLGINMVVHVDDHSNLTLVAIFVNILGRFHSQMIFDLFLGLTFFFHSLDPIWNLVYECLLKRFGHPAASCWEVLHIECITVLKNCVVHGGCSHPLHLR